MSVKREVITSAHTPFFHREKYSKRWSAPKEPRILRSRYLRNYVVYERNHRGRFVKTCMRIFRPGLITVLSQFCSDIPEIQPMTAPTGKIFSIRVRYA